MVRVYNLCGGSTLCSIVYFQCVCAYQTQLFPLFQALISTSCIEHLDYLEEGAIATLLSRYCCVYVCLWEVDLIV